MIPYLQDPDVTLYNGDALETLRQLPDRSVDMVSTSPPFYGLRDYGSDGQIGLEETPDQWVANLVAVFRECRRVLADHGTLWVEIGDSYAGGGYSNHQNTGGLRREDGGRPTHATGTGCKPKDLLGQPWMLAFALRADGWYLRSEIIWARPNPMPESVTDRPTKAHSTVFLLSKQPRYFYDADAIREPHQHDGRNVTAVVGKENSEQHRNGERWPGSGANARSVWTIPTEPTPFAHFATWPRKLIARMIQAGTSERGKCPECGKPWEREVEREKTYESNAGKAAVRSGEVTLGQGVPRTDTAGGNGDVRLGPTIKVTTIGWSPSCAHDEPAPCVVLDPFAGSGTTLLVARHHGRHSIGIELNPDYCTLAASRLAQLSLLTG